MTEKKEDKIRLHILGTRGSVPVDGDEYRIFGGATSCVYVEWNDARILLDAGSGLLRLKDAEVSRDFHWHLFLSHYHADHMMGLPLWKPLYDSRFQMTFCSASFLPPPEHALNALMREPLWPVGANVFRADISYQRLSGTFTLPEGGPAVEYMQAPHPGGVAVYRVSGAGRRIVYATDCELDDKTEKELKEFAKNADIIILDAQYLSQEYEHCCGFGHNPLDRACRLLTDLAPGTGFLFHHAPEHDDALLLRLERQCQQKNANIRFARAGEVITL